MEESRMSESGNQEMNRLKRVSTAELQQAIAEAVSRLLGEEQTVNVTSMTFKNLGATVVMEINPRLSLKI
jgi:hypothetical protein